MGLYANEGLVEERRFRSADSLLPEMVELFQKAKWEPTDLDYVGAGMGPGSFTGIRIGVMAIRALAFALQIPQVGLGSLALYSDEWPILADARIGGVWAEFPGKAPELIAMEVLEERVRPFRQVLSPDLRTLKAKMLKLGFRGEMLEVQPDSSRIGKLLMQASQQGPNPEIVYLRKTQAEIELRL